MGVIEFELTRTVRAGIQDVFDRLADIEGHNDWMPKKGSMLRRTRQTSPGPPALGTTYIDETSAGPTPGEIAEFQPPHTLVYHWWDRSKAGKLKLDGWPAYRLDGRRRQTLVHHSARLHTYRDVPAGQLPPPQDRDERTNRHARGSRGVLRIPRAVGALTGFACTR